MAEGRGSIPMKRGSIIASQYYNSLRTTPSFSSYDTAWSLEFSIWQAWASPLRSPIAAPLHFQPSPQPSLKHQKTFMRKALLGLGLFNVRCLQFIFPSSRVRLSFCSLGHILEEPYSQPRNSHELPFCWACKSQAGTRQEKRINYSVGLRLKLFVLRKER